MSAIPGFSTIREVADRLRVDHSTVARYVRQGLLTAVDVGNQKLIQNDQLDQFRKPLPGNPNLRKRG